MGTASIRERLVLDHFYIPATAEELAALAPIVYRFRDAVHRTVVSGDDHWEGVYLEAVVYPGASNLGLAFSPAQPQYTDAGLIESEFPDLSWKKGTRLDEDRKPWFDWISLVDAEPVVPPPVNAWVMRYHFTHMRERSAPTGPRTVDRFKVIRLDAGAESIPEIRALVPWLPGTQVWEKDRALLALPLSDGHAFRVEISIAAGKAPLTFRSLEMEITRGQVAEPGTFGRFLLSRPDEHTAVLEKR
ncbi:MAG: hypothetical protein KGM24_09930 [Elusimicrobia bacterium]|nr:hypothetical protein [Elusimicrobiota bacterium]